MKNVALALTVVVSATALASAQQGTALSIDFAQPVVSCPAGAVTVDFTISTTAVSAANVTVALKNHEGAQLSQSGYTVLAGQVPGGWTGSGRTKTSDGRFEGTLPDGTYSLEVCATQAGSGGNESKSLCKAQAIVVNCADPNPCASTAPFGEVVGNTQIKEHATAQIQFRGNFGPTVRVEIFGDGGFYRSEVIGRNGDSCNYHANWKFNNESGADFFGNAGAGVYTVKVNGDELVFPVTLTESKSNKP